MGAAPDNRPWSEVEAQCEIISELQKQILTLPAYTIDGLAVKAGIALSENPKALLDPAYLVDRAAASMLKDFRRLSGVEMAIDASHPQIKEAHKTA